MPHVGITTDTETRDFNEKFSEVTGTAVGTKRALDVDLRASGESPRYEFVVDTTPDYGVNDQVGEAIEITDAARISGGGGILTSLSCINLANLAIDIAFHFFRDEPTSTSGDDNSTMAVSDADSELYLFSVSISKGRMHLIGNYVGSIETLYRYECADTSLWVVAQALTATNFAGTDDLQIIVGLDKD